MRANLACFAVKRGEVTKRLNSDYYHPERRVAIEQICKRWAEESRDTLNNVLSFGETISQFDSALPYIGLANVESEFGGYLKTEEEMPEGTCRLHEAGQVLYGKLRPYLNKVHISQSNGQCSTEFYALAAKDNRRLSHEFLAAFLISKPFLSQTTHMMTGNTHPRIQREDFEEIILPLPPLETQKTLVANIEAARITRKQKLADADALLAGVDGSVLEQLGLTAPQEEKRLAFAVRLNVAKSRVDAHFHSPDFHHLVKLVESRSHAKLGSIISFSRETWLPENEGAETFRYIEISGVNLQTGEASATKTSVSEAPSRARMLVRSGDLIVSLTRPHHGAIAMIDAGLDQCVASTGFAVIRQIANKQVHPLYLWCILRSNLCLKQMLQRSSGGNYPAITETELENIVLPLPSLEIQQTIAAEVTRHREQARRLREEANAGWESAKARFERQLLGED